MAKIVIFGGGDIARLANYYFTHDSEYEVAAFTVDEAYLEGDSFLNLPLVSFEEVKRRYPPGDFKMFVALSYARMNQVRAAKCEEAGALGYELVSYVSTRCTYLSEHPPGFNCFILEDNTIQPFVKIGNNVTLWSGNHVGHDSTIGDHCFITSHVVISGNCRVGANSFIGVNATIRNSLKIEEKSIIGAGAVVLRDTVEKGVYISPGAVRQRRSSDEITL